MTPDEIDMAIVAAVTKAVISIREAFDLSSDETESMIDAMYDKLIEIGVLRNENRTK